MTFRFVERALKISATTEHNLDGIVIMKVLIAMIENLQGRIDEALPYIVNICVGQLNLDVKTSKNYVSMVLQTISMCFWYNSPLTFQVLESHAPSSQSTILVFQKLLQTLPTFKHDFELRRVIFGLSGIISTPPQALPAIVGQRISDIAKQLTVTCQKMR